MTLKDISNKIDRMNRKKRVQWIPVVTALMKRGDEVLLGLRPEGHNLAGFWEFPGGKMELGEEPEDSLKRELKEELGIDATIGSIRLTSSHNYGETTILLLFYDVPYWTGEPKTVHHSGLKWVKIDDLEKENLPEANFKVLNKIISVLKNNEQKL